MVCSMQRSVRHNLYHPFRLRLSLYDDILSNERLIQSMIHDVSKKCKYRYIYICTVVDVYMYVCTFACMRMHAGMTCMYV